MILQAVRGILRVKHATVKSSQLAFRFLDAIQSPRLVMNDGDDARGLSLALFPSLSLSLSLSHTHTHTQTHTHDVHVVSRPVSPIFHLLFDYTVYSESTPVSTFPTPLPPILLNCPPSLLPQCIAPTRMTPYLSKMSPLSLCKKRFSALFICALLHFFSSTLFSNIR